MTLNWIHEAALVLSGPALILCLHQGILVIVSNTFIQTAFILMLTLPFFYKLNFAFWHDEDIVRMGIAGSNQ